MVVSWWRGCEGLSERLLPGDSDHGGLAAAATYGRGDPAGPHRGSMEVVGWLISATDEEEQTSRGEA
jgi:hypothetical protein